MKIFLNILFISFLTISWGQQDGLYSQYAYNQFAINPAYAGSRNSFSGVILHRSQWIGIKDAPSINSFTIHSPLSHPSLAYGLSVANESVGPLTNTSVNLSFAYHINFKKSKLSFGVRGGMYHSVFDKNLLTYKQTKDVFNTGGKESSIVPNIDFGTYYYTNRFFAGISFNHLTNERLKFESLPQANNLKLYTHVYIHSGYVFDLKKKIKFKPTVLLKLTEGATPNIDLGMNFMFYEKFWIGVSIRNTTSINLLTEWNIKDYLRIGYAYDYSINKLMKYNSGSHELFLGFDFNLKNKKLTLISPRYL